METYWTNLLGILSIPCSLGICPPNTIRNVSTSLRRKKTTELTTPHVTHNIKGNLAHNFMDPYFLCFSFHLDISNMLKTKYI